MDDELFWQELRGDGNIHVGLTDKAFEIFGQLWSIIPVNDRKRNYVRGEALIAVEGSDSLGSITTPFNLKRVSYNGRSIDRPDELTSSSTLFTAEAAA